MNKKQVIYLFISLVFIIIFLSILTINFYFKLNSCNEKIIFRKDNNFQLVSPNIAWMDLDEFLVEQTYLDISYQELKPVITSAITENVTGNFSVYFEDLTTGAWLGVNEKEKYIPASLLKLPVMVAILKKIEKGELGLYDNITIKKEFLSSEFGFLYEKGEGSVFTVKELLIYIIKDSDNTASRALLSLLTREDFELARTAMGLPPVLDSEKISPKEYSNMLRSLYLSSFLRRRFSELALSLMLETSYNSQISKGIPKDVKLSHKFGVYSLDMEFHDCGIVYYKTPYILCIMSKNTNKIESEKVMAKVSKIIYDYKINSHQ